MDRNKRIAGFVFAGIIALAITSCKVQQPGYVGLYVDNSIAVIDTIDPGEGLLYMADTAITRLVDTTAGIEAEVTGSLRPAEEVQPMYSMQNEIELKQLIQVKSDTIAMLRNQMTVLNKSAGLKAADTVYITKEIVMELKGDSLQADNETTQLLRTKNDSIAFLRKQVHELQNNVSITTDTVYVFKETAKLPGEDSRQTDLMTFQLIKAKDEQIQMLQNQVNAMQTAAATTSYQTQVTREPVQTELLGSQKTDHLTLQLLQAKNDTILFLRTQLSNMRLQSPAEDTVSLENEVPDMQPAKDTVIVENEGIDMQPAKDTVSVENEGFGIQAAKDTLIVVNVGKDIQPTEEIVSEQETSDLLQASQDTVLLLRIPVLSMKEQIIPGMDTANHAVQNKNDVPSLAIKDTILLVAYYEQGKIKPLEEELILKQIEELCSNTDVTKIELSGYTDSSGNELVNKEITNTRLNYLLENIIPWIGKEKVFFQNFGDAYASDRVVTEERKIEIRIHKN